MGGRGKRSISIQRVRKASLWAAYLRLDCDRMGSFRVAGKGAERQRDESDLMLVCLWKMQLTHDAHTHGFAPFLFPCVRYSLYSENSRDSLNVQQIYTGIISSPPPCNLRFFLQAPWITRESLLHKAEWVTSQRRQRAGRHTSMCSGEYKILYISPLKAGGKWKTKKSVGSEN